MGVGDGLCMYNVVAKSSRLLSHLLMSSCTNGCRNFRKNHDQHGPWTRVSFWTPVCTDTVHTTAVRGPCLPAVSTVRDGPWTRPV